MEATLIKDFLGLSRVVNQDPLHLHSTDSIGSKYLPYQKHPSSRKALSVPGKKKAGKGEKKVSCQFFIHAPELAVCKELPCFPSNFACVQMRWVPFSPLLFSGRLFVLWAIPNVFSELHGPFY